MSATFPEGGTRCAALCARLWSGSPLSLLSRPLRRRVRRCRARRHGWVPGDPCTAGDDRCPHRRLPGAGCAHDQGPNTRDAASGSTPISMTPLPFDRTNGDLLAITKIDGTNDLAFGGNFSLVYTPDGVSHAATNFAVLDEASGRPVRRDCRRRHRQIRPVDRQPERRHLRRRRLHLVGRRFPITCGQSGPHR